MSTNKAAARDEEFLLAMWKEHNHIETEYGVLVDFEGHPTQRAGVYCWHLSASGPAVDGSLLAKGAAIKAEWPNSSHQLLAGFLFNQMIKLGSMVAEFRALEKERHDSPEG